MSFRRSARVSSALILLMSQAALAQEAVDLRYGPEPGVPEIVKTTVRAQSTVSDVPGAPAPSAQHEKHTFWSRPEIIDAPADGELAYWLKLERLAIEIQRPGWDRGDYFSWLPKRSPSAAIRRLDGVVFHKPEILAAFDPDSGQVRTPGGAFDQLKSHVDKSLVNPMSPRDELDTARDTVLDQAIAQSLDMGLSLLPGRDAEVGETWIRRRELIMPYCDTATITWTCTLRSAERGQALIEATPQIDLRAPAPAGDRIVLIPTGTAGGDARLIYDIDDEMLVEMSKRLEIPFRVSRPVPGGGREEFSYALQIDVSHEPMFDEDLPQRR